jgi:hypothetical protein
VLQALCKPRAYPHTVSIHSIRPSRPSVVLTPRITTSDQPVTDGVRHTPYPTAPPFRPLEPRNQRKTLASLPCNKGTTPGTPEHSTLDPRSLSGTYKAESACLFTSPATRPFHFHTSLLPQLNSPPLTNRLTTTLQPPTKTHYHQNPHPQPGAMASTSSTYHIPFPSNFLTVNTPVTKAHPIMATTSTLTEQPAHGFLSNRPATLPRHQSVSSDSSIASAAPSEGSAPSSPPTKAAAPAVSVPKAFTPLQVNARARIVPVSIADMTPVARSAYLSNRH